MDLLLLTTVGAKSGQPRTLPLGYTTDGDRIVVNASRGGGRYNPDWFHNLVANPIVTVEIGTEKFQARARVTEGEERERLFAERATPGSRLESYQQRTTRVIPIIVLERLD
jgi:deazaflavin-dependent oxidoreductase (nitroreductase family)